MERVFILGLFLVLYYISSSLLSLSELLIIYISL